VDVPTAARRIAALFPDEGATVLSEADLPRTWELALAAVPAEWLEVPEDLDADAQGEQLLVHVREHFSQQNQLRPALAITRGLARRRVARLGEEHPDALVELGALGALADRVGKLAEAEPLLVKAYEGLRSTAGGRDLRLAVVAQNLAWHWLRASQAMKAEQCLEQAFRIRRDVAPETTGPVAAQIGELLVRRQKHAEAVPYLQEAWERYRDQYGENDTRSVARARTLAAILVGLDRDTEAIPVLRVVLAAATREGDLEKRASIAFQLGSALENVGQREESMRLVEEAVRWTREAGDPHPELATRLSALSRMALRRGRPTEAEGLLQEALEADRIVHGDDSAEAAVRLGHLGHFYAQQGRLGEALGFLEPAASALRATLGDGHWQTRLTVEVLVGLWIQIAREAVQQRRHGDARELLLRGDALARGVLGPRHHTVDTISQFGLI
jgi:tetratricopeptide (TPR) repeat protein